jgi:hypothetical protein
MILNLIRDLGNQLLSYIKDDPVRPEITADYRVSQNRLIAALVAEERPSAMVCISLHDFVPATLQELDQTSDTPTIAIFYTIWSYQGGAGRDLLAQAVPKLKAEYPTLTRFVTLSPKTEMARRFHLKNGAVIFRENTDTINYEYPQDK